MAFGFGKKDDEILEEIGRRRHQKTEEQSEYPGLNDEGVPLPPEPERVYKDDYKRTITKEQFEELQRMKAAKKKQKRTGARNMKVSLNELPEKKKEEKIEFEFSDDIMKRIDVLADNEDETSTEWLSRIIGERIVQDEEA